MSELPKPILILPSGSNPSVISLAEEAGYLVLLTDSPSTVQVLRPESQTLTGDVLARAALAAIAAMRPSNAVHYAFSQHLHDRVQGKGEPQ